jgi:cell division transport system permease protein
MIAKILIRHLQARPLSSALTVLAVAAALTLLGSFWTISENLEKVRMSQTRAGESPNITFFVDPSLSANEVAKLQANISERSYFSGIETIKPVEAGAELEKQFGKALTDALGSETFPLMIKAKLASDNINSNAWNVQMNELRSLPGVLDVDDGSDVLPTAGTSISSKAFSWSTIFLVAVLLVVSLLVSHLIRLIFESNRNELETLKVLGASKSWVFFPLIVESAIIGFVASTIALGTLYWIVKGVLPQYSQLLLPSGTQLQALSAGSNLGLLALGMFAAMLGALFTWPLVNKPAAEG